LMLNSVRQTTGLCVQNAKYVTIDHSELEKYTQTLSVEEVRAKSNDRRRFPLKFTSVEQEVNFLCVLGILNFGSGFSEELRQCCDRSTSEAIAFGCMAMHLSTPNIDADFLAKITETDVSELFGLPIDEEYQDEGMHGIYKYRKSAVFPLISAIRSVLHDSARRLQNQRFSSFAHFILLSPPPSASTPSASTPSASATASISVVEEDDEEEEEDEEKEKEEKEEKDGANVETAEGLVGRLVDMFPAFADYAEITLDSSSNSSSSSSSKVNVYLLHKVQLFVAELNYRLSETEPKLAFRDMDKVTAFADAVLPSVLRHYGVVKYHSKLAHIIDSGSPLTNQRMEAEVRSAAVVACETIVSHLRESAASSPPVSAQELCFYLREVGSTPEMRNLVRHSSKATVFY